MEQTGRDSALPEGTNYQDFISKTNILQSNHILHSLLHCSVCVCTVLVTMTWINCRGRDWISSRGIIQELLRPIFIFFHFFLALSFCS